MLEAFQSAGVVAILIAGISILRRDYLLGLPHPSERPILG